MQMSKNSMTGLVLGIALVAVLGLIFLTAPAPKPDINNNTNPTGVITLSTSYDRQSLPAEFAASHNLTDKLIMIESKYCGACRDAMPKIEALEQEMNVSFIFYDLAEDADRAAVTALGLEPTRTPTFLFGSKVVIGDLSKDEYRSLIDEFLGAQ